MGKMIHRSKEQAANHLREIGVNIRPERIERVYPTHFPEREVVRVLGERGEQKVIKVRPDDPQGKARRESRNLEVLFKSYRFAGCTFPEEETVRIEKSEHMKFNMSFLGLSLGELGQQLDLQQRGYSGAQEDVIFSGFQRHYADYLLRRLKLSHREFAEKEGYVHGDMFQAQHPNNIVYHELEDSLFLVAEALGRTTTERLEVFNKQVEKVHKWVIDNLVV